MPADTLTSLSAVNQSFTDNPASLGFAFTANENFTVTSLGWLDSTGAGFQSPHSVGIFDSQGDLLTSVTLAPGTSGFLQGSFRYAAITPVTLTAGDTYTLAGTSGGNADSWTVNDYVTGFGVSPEFTIGPNAALFDYTAVFVEPTSHYSDYRAYLGPNLIGNAAAVVDPVSQTPEPGTIAFVSLAFAGLAALGGKNRLGKANGAR